MEDLAKMFDLSVRRIQQYAQEGVVVRVPGRRNAYDLVLSVRGVVAYWQQRAEGRAGEPGKGSVDEIKRQILELELEEKRIDLERTRGTMVTVDAAEEVMAEALAALDGALRNLPSVIVPLITGREAAEVFEVVEDVVEDIRTELRTAFRLTQEEEAGGEEVEPGEGEDAAPGEEDDG